MSRNAGRQAREQAKQYKSIFAPSELTLDDGTVIEVPPHPNLRLLDDDALVEMDKLNLELESYDREPDIYIPEQTVKATDGSEMTLPAETKPGPLKTPHRKTNPETGEVELMDPPYSVRVAQIAIGKENYEKLRNGTINGKRGSAAHLWRIWNEQNFDVFGRQASDSKSDGGARAVEGAPSPDSQ